MKHTALLNPFNLNQEPGQIANRQEPAEIVSRRASRSTPVCSVCQSDDIIAHATVQWSNESQEWELADTFNQPAHCNYCNRACDILWLPLNSGRENAYGPRMCCAIFSRTVGARTAATARRRPYPRQRVLVTSANPAVGLTLD